VTENSGGNWYPDPIQGMFKRSSTPTNGSTEANTLRQIVEKYRQAAQHASSDPLLANQLGAVATDTDTDTDTISTTVASGGSPSPTEENQLSHDEDTLNKMCPAG
jgi:hypothetical protein